VHNNALTSCFVCCFYPVLAEQTNQKSLKNEYLYY